MLVPIKIKITRGARSGQLVNIYPDFNKLRPEVRDNMDWSLFFDSKGIGWHYDKLSGFGESDEFNDDPGVQYGCTCVPLAFAEEAVTTFPDLVEIIDEEEFEAFYDDRSHVNEPEEIIDESILNALNVKLQMGMVQSFSDENALNPDHPSPGIRKNHRKRWADFKNKGKIKIDKDAVERLKSK